MLAIRLLKAFIKLSVAIFGAGAFIVLLNFPYDYDRPLTLEDVEAAQRYYADAYGRPASAAIPSEYETNYLRVAEMAAQRENIEGVIRSFVGEFDLADKAVLEIGSGRGYLQDVVGDYTGLDISPSVAHFYRKKFVLGSATSLPFSDNSFDAIWSIWVFEHVQNPEQAFAEARRVVKHGGLLYLKPAWNVPAWTAEGYPIRPYSDFGWIDKMIKLSIPLRHNLVFAAINMLPVRALRIQVARYGPTRLRYHRLKANYQKYWMPDSDAVNSIDIHEAMLWFTSRGDTCLNCGAAPIFLPFRTDPLIIQVNKR